MVALLCMGRPQVRCGSKEAKPHLRMPMVVSVTMESPIFSSSLRSERSRCSILHRVQCVFSQRRRGWTVPIHFQFNCPAVHSRRANPNAAHESRRNKEGPRGSWGGNEKRMSSAHD